MTIPEAINKPAKKVVGSYVRNRMKSNIMLVKSCPTKESIVNGRAATLGTNKLNSNTATTPNTPPK